MIAKVYSAIPQGYNGHLVEVEGDTSRSLPAFNIVGMANKTVSESRERVRAAIVNSGFRFPDKRVTINLAPAELTKDGTYLDLPIALAVLALSQQLLAGDLHGRLFAGELSLDGQTKPIRGIINIIETATIAGFQEIYIPLKNLPQARLVPNATVIGVDNLKSLILHFKGIKPLPVHKNHQTNTKFSTQTPSTSVISNVVKNNCSEVGPTIHSEIANQQNSSVVKITKTDETQINFSHPISESTFVVKNNKTGDNPIDSTVIVKNTKTDAQPLNYLLDHIHGQFLAKRALTISIAGGHNLLLSGPPGSGKTMLAKVARNLLPPPSLHEQVEITKLHNLVHSTTDPRNTRPFRSPHHTSSATAIIGGGPHILPGEISLAHRGILFLDEMPEYSRLVLESLRQPLEDRSITVARASGRATYPANFILIGTMNPCPCGHFGDPHHPCTCLPNQLLNYQKRLSGPILDRIDLTLQVKKVDSQNLIQNVVENTKTDIEHRSAYTKILVARARQSQRYHNVDKLNGSLSSFAINQHLNLSPDAKHLLQTATDKLNLSARSYFKVIKVAQTISDIESSSTDAPDIITPEHIAEALTFRERPYQAP